MKSYKKIWGGQKLHHTALTRDFLPIISKAQSNKSKKDKSDFTTTLNFTYRGSCSDPGG